MITSKAANKAYLDNYDRIFGKQDAAPADEREQEVEEAETKDSEQQS